MKARAYIGYFSKISSYNESRRVSIASTAINTWTTNDIYYNKLTLFIN